MCNQCTAFTSHAQRQKVSESNIIRSYRLDNSSAIHTQHRFSVPRFTQERCARGGEPKRRTITNEHDREMAVACGEIMCTKLKRYKEVVNVVTRMDLRIGLVAPLERSRIKRRCVIYNGI